MLYRLLSRLGLRWLVISAIGRYVVRRLGQATVEQAGRDLQATAEDRLPAPLDRAVSSLPPEAVQLGGTAVVAGRAARGAVVTTRRAGRVASGATRRGAAGIGAARSIAERSRAAIDDVRDQLATETDSSRRRLRARYLGATVGPSAATDALLDARVTGATDHDRIEDDDRHPTDAINAVDTIGDTDPHDRVPEPVTPGRRRRRRTRPALIDRVQRTYRPPSKPWD